MRFAAAVTRNHGTFDGAFMEIGPPTGWAVRGY
jgi:hypothetical protein